jgi:DNA-binding transcriptional LysR family regulator
VELRHLRYFVAVADALGYRRAAANLHISQPALSKQIKELETQVGARLLHRNTGGVRLTEAGAVLLEETRDILERVEMAVTATQEADAGRGGHLTIGSLGAISASFLPVSLAAFRARFPQVEVELHEASMPDQISALTAGTIHLGFVTAQGVSIPSHLATVEVLVARLAVAIGREHRFARRPAVSLSELAEESILCLGDAGHHDLHQKFVAAIFNARGIRHRPIKRVNSYESLVALVAGGHGVSMLLPLNLAQGKNAILFRRVAEDGDDLIVRLLAVWRKSGGSQLARNFVEVLRSGSKTAPNAQAGRAAAASVKQALIRSRRPL